MMRRRSRLEHEVFRLDRALALAREQERALRQGLAEQGFEPSGEGTVYDALGAVKALKDVRDEAWRKHEILRRQLRHSRNTLDNVVEVITKANAKPLVAREPGSPDAAR